MKRLLVVLSSLLLVSLVLAQDKPGKLEFVPLKPVVVDTNADVRIDVETKPAGKETAFTIASVMKDGKKIDPPASMKLDAKTGEFAWTPRPSAAGVYELTFQAKEGERTGKQSVQVTIRPRTITTDKGAIGKLLQAWYKEGTAAGNTGDFYDNRDGDHSPLRLGPWPQLDQVHYTPADLKSRRNWAAQRVLLPHVTFGNSSTSAQVTRGGSNIRMYYTNPRGMDFLSKQYRGNNLYIYPEHRDHDPGHNGPNGYGDLYPLNSPYLIASQGSSGSDQPFMRAMPYVLAAFRPDVKKKLIETGTLMPTIQMILRSTNKHLTKPEEYLTGKAHPTVFEGKWVDPLKMVEKAHGIQLDSLPPLVQLEVVEQDKAEPGKDYFDPTRAETLCDTPDVIARIYRTKKAERRMVVSAEKSFDVNKKPLKYHWVVLRGQATIKPKNEAGSVAEIIVPYQERFELEEPTKIGTTRVDVGVFVDNGTHTSAPAFICHHFLDDEARTYTESGQPIDIGYDAGSYDLSVRDWNKLFAYLDAGQGKLSDDPLLSAFTKEERAALNENSQKYRDAALKLEAAKKATAAAAKNRKAADDARKEAEKLLKLAEKEQKNVEQAKAKHEKAVAEFKTRDKEWRDARNAEQETGKAADAILDAKQETLKASIRARVEHALDRYRDNPTFYVDRLEPFGKLATKDTQVKARLEAGRKRLEQLGILKSKGKTWELTTAAPGKGPAAKRLTRYERNSLARFHGELLQALYPDFISGRFSVNTTDQRLALKKPWRDVYRRDGKGRPLGWTRHSIDRVAEFNPSGLLIVEKDDLGRAKKARTVRYQVDPKTRQVRATPGDEIVEYEYAGPDDFKGKAKSRGE